MTTPPAPHVAELTEVQLTAWRGTLGWRKPLGHGRTWVKLSRHLHYPDRRPHPIAEHITALALPDTPTLHSTRLHPPAGTPEVERTIKLPTDQAQRLYEFFEHCYMRPAPAFNSHYLIRRLTGINPFTDPQLTRCLTPCYTPEETTPDQLDLGVPYGFVPACGHLFHSFLGLGDGIRLLSLPLGFSQPLILANTQRFGHILYSRSIHRILPDTIDVTMLDKKTRTQYRHHGRQHTPAQTHTT